MNLVIFFFSLFVFLLGKDDEAAWHLDERSVLWKSDCGQTGGGNEGKQAARMSAIIKERRYCPMIPALYGAP